MALPFSFSNLFNKNRINVSKTNTDSPLQKAKLSGSNNTLSQVVNNGPPKPTTEEVEQQRRVQLVAQLRNQWLLSNDGITPARMAGLEWGQGEQDWLNQQLQARGENWKV